jgi:endonuclease I
MRQLCLTALAASAVLFSAASLADTTPQTLPFSQDWSNVGLITAANDWSGVPGIAGFTGNGVTALTTTGQNPQLLLADDVPATLNVTANQTDPTLAGGGIFEFEPLNVVAFQGSNTSARAPYLLLSLTTTGKSGITAAYNLRDVDGSVDNAVQPVALHYRIGTTGPFTDVPAAFVADASSGPSLATLVTPVFVTLPAAVDNQALVQLRIMTANAAGNDEFIGIDDIVIGGGPAVDVPPTVSSSVPANNATNVVFNSNLSVTFSEAVTVTGAWYTLTCATSGAHTAVVTGGPTSYTLDPSPDFAFGESCTLTVIAANVVDIDGTPNPMASNAVINFAIAADVAPSVSSTVPANSATGVSLNSNLTVNFSEPVSVTGAWYSLSCATTGANLAAIVSGGPASFVLDPTPTFANSELCTLTINAANVLDLDGTPNAMAANYVTSFTTQPSVGNYYATVNASNATLLRSTLHALIRGHTCYFYSGPTTGLNVWTILEDADQAPGDSTKILDVYKNALYTKITDRAGTNPDATNSYNREHTWPNSYGFNDILTATGNGGASFAYCPYTDTHMLYASNVSYNSTRSNLIYDNCPGCAELATQVNAGQGGAGFPNRFVAGTPTGGGKFEPWDKRKGDLARAVLYMDIRYEGGMHPVTGINEPNLIATDDLALVNVFPSGQFSSTGYMGKLATLIAWNLADPPSPEEVVRNGKIYGYQGNRNPFIDHPEWVNCLYLGQCGTVNEIYFKDGFE